MQMSRFLFQPYEISKASERGFRGKDLDYAVFYGAAWSTSYRAAATKCSG